MSPSTPMCPFPPPPPPPLCIPLNSLTTQTASRFLPVKYHEMTHLPCRVVNPPMPCFFFFFCIKKKKPGQCFTVSGSSLAVGYTYTPNIRIVCALLLIFVNDLPVKRQRLSLSSLRCHFNEFLPCCCWLFFFSLSPTGKLSS